METIINKDLTTNKQTLFILPMRNGNIFFSQASASLNVMPFYPTYEEWKRSLDSSSRRSSHPFYPTYEEWKLSSI